MKKTFNKKWMKLFSVFVLGIVFSISMSGQTSSAIDVKGVVNDNLGPVPGASVSIKGTLVGTLTDINGEFSLKASSDATLVVSMVGYNAQEVRVSSSVSVFLTENVELLEEVVVIGYGSVKKKDATGSVTAIKVDEMNKGLAVTAQDLLVGKISGVSVMSNGGRPGEGATIRIRGGSSLSATNDPLVVIDGVIMSNDLAGSSNFLSMVNPSDIETFTVLKDASATAIYGSRASNGVILITTKKGASGKPKIAYNANFSVNTRRNSVDVLNADEYHRFVVDRFYGTQEFDAVKAKLGKANTNWQDEIFRTAYATDHNVSVFGSVKTMPYRVSAGYTSEEGILKTTNMERGTASIVLSPTFFDSHLKIDLNAKGMLSKTRFAETGAIGSALSFDPTQPVQNGSIWGGYFAWTNKAGAWASIAGKNPVGMLKMRDNQADVNNIVANLQADYKLHFLPEMRVNMNLGIDVANTDGVDYQSPWSPASYSEDDAKSGSRKRFENYRNNQLLEFYTQYVKDVASIKSKFDVMAGYSWQHYKKSSDEYSHWVSKTDNSDLELSGARNNYNFKEYYLLSFFGRFNYAFNEKYLLTFTMRRDGSSRFDEGNRWGAFPSLGLAWRMSDETFFKNIDALSDLKLRLGWGKTGQQDLGDDFYYPSKPSYLVGKEYGYYPMGLNPDGSVNWVKQMKPKAYNPKLKWETTTTWNAGLDYGFLNSRINGAIDVYSRKTEDLLNKEAPTMAGVTFAERMPQNIGVLENKGVEFSVNARPIVTKNLEWEIGYNISYNQGKITKLVAHEAPDYKGQSEGNTGGDGNQPLQRYIRGYAPRSFYVYEQVYNADGKPLEGIYVDRNQDGTIDEKDLYLYKKPAADVIMGFNSKVIYKSWDLGFNGRVSLGNYSYNAMAANNSELNSSAIHSNTISLSNRPQSAFETNFQNKQLLSDYYVQNASFLKIDNITLGYSLKKLAAKKLNARLYATVQNPIVITQYGGLDPEVTDGIDFNFYPRPLRFMVGFNLNF